MNSIAAGTKQVIPVLLYLVAAVFGSLGQYFYKTGALRIGLVPWFRNWQIFSGFGLFCIVMTLFLFAFKLGGKISVVYPAYATTFIWGTLIAVYMSKEVVSLNQITGIAIIILGVTVVTFGR